MSVHVIAAAVAVLVPLVFVVVLLVIVVAIARGTHQNRLNRKAPRISLPATVVTKRTATRGGGETATSSVYYATFEMPDGSRAELSMRGEEFGLLVEGDRGLLTRQGAWFKGFQRSGLVQDSPLGTQLPPR